MKVLRVFWIHHTDKKLVENRKSGLLETRYKKVKRQSDFPPDTTHEEAAESIFKEFGRMSDYGYFHPKTHAPTQYAEVVSHTITEDSHAKDESIKADKAFQDPLFDPVTWQGLHKERV